MIRQPRPPHAGGLAAGLVALGALMCTGDASGPNADTVATVTITPGVGILDTGDSLSLTAVARNAHGDPLPSKSITWNALDTAVATVSADGRARGVWPGSARIVAASEGRADTAQLRVIARITSVVLLPGVDTAASLGEEVTLSLQPYVGDRPHAGGAYAWTLSDTSVALLTVSGDSALTARIVARANGVVRVRVREARGAADSSLVVVHQRTVSVEVTPSPARVYRSCPAPLVARALDARGNRVEHARVAWTSSDTTLVAVDSAGVLAPRRMGGALVTASVDGVNGQASVTIVTAPPFALQMIGVTGLVSTVGVTQYAAGRGLGTAVTAPATFTVVSSDTTRLAVDPATVGIGAGGSQVDGIRLLGRAAGAVMLTPHTCDVPGPAFAVMVTPPRLFLFDSLPAGARTDDPPGRDYVNTGDTTGAAQYPAEPLTVRLHSTDSLVLRPDSQVRRFAPGVARSAVSVRWVGPGIAQLVAEDSTGRYHPDTSAAVRVVHPPLLLFGDTTRLGMRQGLTASVGVDRVVSDALVRVYLSSSAPVAVRVTPDSVDIPIGDHETVIHLAGGDTVGAAVVTAAAAGRTSARSVVAVERPQVRVVPLFEIGLPRHMGDPPGLVFVGSGSAVPLEDVTFTIASSDSAVLAVDSSTLTVRAGQGASGPAPVHFRGPGSAVLTAVDSRPAFYRYAPDTSPPVTVVERRLMFDETVVALGPARARELVIRVAGALAADLRVSVSHTNAGVTVLSDTTAVVARSVRHGAVRATAVAPGVDTIVASVTGWIPDTLVILVGSDGVVLVGAGDIADCGSAGDEATALLLDSIAGTVFTAGDNVYSNGTATEFANCYDPSWGRHRTRTRPSPGNHDYNTGGASAYYAYFGEAAGPPGRGYYSYDLGAWHVISLNSNVSMAAGSAQEQWLRADLAASSARCTIAYWHHPRFSAGRHGSSTGPAALWQALSDAGAEVVVVGHDHNYQRFAPQTAAGVRDDARGIRQFVVGTGGRDHYDFAAPIANTEAYNTDTHGVLKLTLFDGWYAWEFVPVAGATFRDSGGGTCH